MKIIHKNQHDLKKKTNHKNEDDCKINLSIKIKLIYKIKASHKRENFLRFSTNMIMNLTE